MLFKFALAVITDYLNYSYPHMVNAANRLTSDLIDKNPSWKAEDFINLCKFFRQNPTETYGQMTPEKFMLKLVEYEEQRTQAFEQHYRENRGKQIEANSALNPLAEKLALKMKAEGKEPTGDKVLGKEMDRQREYSERRGYGTNVTPKQGHNDFFEK